MNSRRELLKRSAALVSAMSLGGVAGEAKTTRERSYRRIAAEEAFAPSEWIVLMRNMLKQGKLDEANKASWGIFLDPSIAFIPDGLTDLPQGRLRYMDENDIAMQVVSLTAPGVQIFNVDDARNLAMIYNDYLADIVKSHPDRFAGLAAVAPQDPGSAAKEIDRAVSKLGLRGVIINSHTHGEYLDDRKFWPIFEAAVAKEVPIYLHPTYPTATMWPSYKDYGLGGAIWGFAAETGLHSMRLILGRVFDEFPTLKIVLGHMGESIPFWFWRLDYMYKAMKGAASPTWPMPKRSPSEYFLDNFIITTSGMNWHPVLKFCHEVLGPERIMFAIDYPYQRDTPDAIQFMDTAPIPEEDKQKIYHGNAEKIFGLSKISA